MSYFRNTVYTVIVRGFYRTMPWQDVRLSVTRRYCVKTAKHYHQTSPTSSVSVSE